MQGNVPADRSSSQFSFGQADIEKAVTAQPPDYKALASDLMNRGTQVGPNGWDTSSSLDERHALVGCIEQSDSAGLHAGPAHSKQVATAPGSMRGRLLASK